MKKLLLLTLVISMIVMSVSSAFACTGFFVGKEASANGTYIFGHTVDAWNGAQATVRVHEHVEEAGRTFDPYGAGTIAFPLPEVTYSYTTNEWIDGIYDGSVANEMGVGVSGATTCYITDAISEMDPCIYETGLAEAFLCKLVGMCASTAREGVEVLGQYVEMYGNAEQNTIVIADQNEAWYVEYYTGHQWCAVKIPDDCVAVYGNESMLHTVDKDSEDVMYSEGLFSMPEEAGLAVYDENGNMDLFETYSGGKETLGDYSNRRTWFGHVLLAPSTAGEYVTDKYYDLFYTPDEKVTLTDVFELTRARFEGTEFCPEENDDVDAMRVIGIERQVNIGAVEIYDNLPAAMSCVTWTSMANAEHSVYLPVSNLITKAADRYEYMQGMEEGNEGGMDEAMAHYCFKRLCALAEQKRSLYGNGVRAYWKSVEDALVSEYPTVLAETAELFANDPAAAAEYITNYTVDLQNQAVDTAIEMYNELIWFMINYTNTQLDPSTIAPFVPSCAATEEADA